MTPQSSARKARASSMIATVFRRSGLCALSPSLALAPHAGTRQFIGGFGWPEGKWRQAFPMIIPAANTSAPPSTT
jgi:hypothetical protein